MGLSCKYETLGDIYCTCIIFYYFTLSIYSDTRRLFHTQKRISGIMYRKQLERHYKDTGWLDETAKYYSLRVKNCLWVKSLETAQRCTNWIHSGKAGCPSPRSTSAAANICQLVMPSPVSRVNIGLSELHMKDAFNVGSGCDRALIIRRERPLHISVFPSAGKLKSRRLQLTNTSLMASADT